MLGSVIASGGIRGLAHVWGFAVGLRGLRLMFGPEYEPRSDMDPRHALAAMVDGVQEEFR